jgi:hypothetical protein
VLGLAAGGVIAETPDYLPDEGKTHLPDIDRVVHEEGVRAILGAPLRVAGRVVGAVMIANRRPGAFTPPQREHLEQVASLAAAAVELVAAKQNEAAAKTLAARAVDERDRATAAGRLRAELEERLAGELAEHRGIEDLLVVAASSTGARVSVVDPTGAVLASSPTPIDGPPGSAAVAENPEASAPLVGGAAPGRVIVGAGAEGVPLEIVATVVARYASIALLYERTIDDVRHFHENELVSAILSAQVRGQSAPSTSMVQRALGADGVTSVAVLVPADPDESSRRRLLARLRQATRNGRNVVAGHVGRVVVVARGDEEALRERIAPLPLGLAYFGGIAGAANLAAVPIAYAEAVAISSAMRALGRPRVLAGAAEAGIAGLLLRDGDTETAQRFLRAHLGPLLSGARGDALMTTALAYLDANGAVSDAAPALGLHPNTVRQRIDRIDLLMGPEWRTAPRRLDVHVALRLWRIAGG